MSASLSARCILFLVCGRVLLAKGGDLWVFDMGIRVLTAVVNCLIYVCVALSVFLDMNHCYLLLE